MADTADNLPLGERCHRALVQAARVKVEALTARKLAERVYDRILLDAEGSIPVREAKARVHEKFIAAEDAALKLESDAIIAKAHADGLQIRFEEFRTQAATSRAEMNLR